MTRDLGPNGRRGSKAMVKLADTVQGMMASWTEDNFQQYEETMKLIREGAPVQWVKLYLEAVKLGIEKNTNINININRQKDREDLQALVRSRIPMTDKAGLQYFFTGAIVSANCSVPCRLYISAWAGIITTLQAVKAFTVSIPRAGGVSITI